MNVVNNLKLAKKPLIYRFENTFEPYITNTTFQSSGTFQFLSHALRGHYFVEKSDLQETTNANWKKGPVCLAHIYTKRSTAFIYIIL